jgi:hypothetical protein
MTESLRAGFGESRGTGEQQQGRGTSHMRRKRAAGGNSRAGELEYRGREGDRDWDRRGQWFLLRCSRIAGFLPGCRDISAVEDVGVVLHARQGDMAI